MGINDGSLGFRVYTLLFNYYFKLLLSLSLSSLSLLFIIIIYLYLLRPSMGSRAVQGQQLLFDIILKLFRDNQNMYNIEKEYFIKINKTFHGRACRWAIG